MIDYVILIPTLNRADLLNDALQAYALSPWKDKLLIILDNGNQDIKKFDHDSYINYDLSINGIKFNLDTIHDNWVVMRDWDSKSQGTKAKNFGVSNSWNYMIEYAIAANPELTHFLILNDDIVFDTEKYADIESIIQESGSDKFIEPERGNWCCFILPKIIYANVGLFDGEFYPAYFEDNDYDIRMKLAGHEKIRHIGLNPKIFRNSQTIAKEPTVNQFQKNMDYYIKKWGGMPHNEKFTVPFNKI